MSTEGQPPPPPPPPAAAEYDDVTLVHKILDPWVASGINQAEGAAHLVDVYSAGPNELSRTYNPAAVSKSGKKVWYFLGHLRLKSVRYMSREVDGGGLWLSEGSETVLHDPLNAGRVVGYRRTLSFVWRAADAARIRTGWVMKEFQLHRYGVDGDEGVAGRKVEGPALFKVYRSKNCHGVGKVSRKAAPRSAPKKKGAAAATSPLYDSNAEVEVGATVATGTATPAAPGPKPSDGEDASLEAAKNHADAKKMVGATAAPGPKPADGEDPRRASLKDADAESQVSATAAAATAPGHKAADTDAAQKRAGAEEAYPQQSRKRAAADDEASTPARKKTAPRQDSPEIRFCPMCGFHLGSIQVRK